MEKPLWMKWVDEYYAKGGRELPVIMYRGKEHYVDFRLGELRPVKIDLGWQPIKFTDMPEGTDSEIKSNLRGLRSSITNIGYIRGLDDVEKSNTSYKIGDIVLVRGEKDIPHKILELKGDRVLVEAQIPGWTIKPTSTIMMTDILAKAALKSGNPGNPTELPMGYDERDERGFAYEGNYLGSEGKIAWFGDYSKRNLSEAMSTAQKYRSRGIPAGVYHKNMKDEEVHADLIRQKAKMAYRKSSNLGNERYDVVDINGKFVLINQTEQQIIDFADTLSYYEQRDTGEGPITNFQDAKRMIELGGDERVVKHSSNPVSNKDIDPALQRIFDASIMAIQDEAENKNVNPEELVLRDMKIDSGPIATEINTSKECVLRWIENKSRQLGYSNTRTPSSSSNIISLLESANSSNEIYKIINEIKPKFVSGEITLIQWKEIDREKERNLKRFEK